MHWTQPTGEVLPRNDPLNCRFTRTVIFLIFVMVIPSICGGRRPAAAGGGVRANPELFLHSHLDVLHEEMEVQDRSHFARCTTCRIYSTNQVVIRRTSPGFEGEGRRICAT